MLENMKMICAYFLLKQLISEDGTNQKDLYAKNTKYWKSKKDLHPSR